MIKWIRNLFIAAAIIFSINTAKAQGSFFVGNGNYNQWILSNNSCYGCGSFHVMVVNNPVPDNGWYYYDIYFWSNSYYTNGYAANSYVKSVNIYMLNLKGEWNLVIKYPYVVVPPKSDNFNGYFYVGYIYSTSKMQSIKISWSEVSAW